MIFFFFLNRNHIKICLSHFNENLVCVNFYCKNIVKHCESLVSNLSKEYFIFFFSLLLLKKNIPLKKKERFLLKWRKRTGESSETEVNALKMRRKHVFPTSKGRGRVVKKKKKMVEKEEDSRIRRSMSKSFPHGARARCELSWKYRVFHEGFSLSGVGHEISFPLCCCEGSWVLIGQRNSKGSVFWEWATGPQYLPRNTAIRIGFRASLQLSKTPPPKVDQPPRAKLFSTIVGFRPADVTRNEGSYGSFDVEFNLNTSISSSLSSWDSRTIDCSNLAALSNEKRAFCDLNGFV